MFCFHVLYFSPLLTALSVIFVTEQGASQNGAFLFPHLDRLGVRVTLVQRILRQSNVATTRTHYIKAVEQDVSTAMEKLENSLLDTNQTPVLNLISSKIGGDGKN